MKHQSDRNFVSSTIMRQGLGQRESGGMSRKGSKEAGRVMHASPTHARLPSLHTLLGRSRRRHRRLGLGGGGRQTGSRTSPRGWRNCLAAKTSRGGIAFLEAQTRRAKNRQRALHDQVDGPCALAGPACGDARAAGHAFGWRAPGCCGVQRSAACVCKSRRRAQSPRPARRNAPIQHPCRRQGLQHGA